MKRIEKGASASGRCTSGAGARRMGVFVALFGALACSAEDDGGSPTSADAALEEVDARVTADAAQPDAAPDAGDPCADPVRVCDEYVENVALAAERACGAQVFEEVEARLQAELDCAAVRGFTDCHDFTLLCVVGAASLEFNCEELRDGNAYFAACRDRVLR